TLNRRPGRPPAAAPLLGRPGSGRVLWARPGDATRTTDPTRAADGAGGRAGGAAWLHLPDGVVGLAPSGAPLGPRWVCRAEPWPAPAGGDSAVVDDDGLRTAEGPPFLDHRQAVGWLG